MLQNGDTMTKVIFCGENPEIRLMKPGTTDQEVAFLSYWHCTYSPHGVGRLLVFRNDSRTLIHADNVPLGRFIADSLVQHFPDIHRANLPSVPVTAAQLTQQTDPDGTYHVRSAVPGEVIEATWSGVLDVRLPRMYENIISVQDTVLDVSTVICPVSQAAIAINGIPLDGHVHAYHDGTLHRSTAFLAFSETWVSRTRRPRPPKRIDQ
jgi:hypothetical protein